MDVKPCETGVNTTTDRLGEEDKKVADDTIDKLHWTGKVGWMKFPTSLACPMIVAWRTVQGQRKGRVVFDLRHVNANALPDIYPIPSQEDMINQIRGVSECRGNEVLSIKFGFGFAATPQ